MAELALQRDQQNQLMAQLEVQRRTTENHDQGLRAAAASSILQAEALEDMRRRTSARWHAFTATPAPQTVQAPATVGVHLVYGFQEVPKAPTFNGSTKVQKRRFMDQYEAYIHAYQRLYRPAGGGTHSVLGNGKPSHELNDEDWRDYFLSARNGDPVDMTKLNQAMGKLKMDRSIISAESRVSKRVNDFEAPLVRLYMEGFAETEPKLTVDFLMAAITPLAVQKRVRELMKLHENRAYKNDARSFKNWLAEYMRRYDEFEPRVQAASLPPKPVPEKVKELLKKLKGNRGHPKKGNKAIAVFQVSEHRPQCVQVSQCGKW
ncbi:hypothetical protein H310_04255 [Aphanomyces invadans]|uniref:Uncharacterized protein n=1 Tax=Aphanomyces invadans TaxID=157072 RepID=A0A024UHF8_9STRA|nr:hypothetical protein H310_04255 [Aphanomyces invadans]ETW05302.1 hypothetical protein H310_04255 [Aphanomyces invadans]|eukprot:XP_008866740.1 hypothetical protein H310_04255 [Aphanomyces invadans]